MIEIDLDLYLTEEEQEYYREYLWFMTSNNYFDLITASPVCLWWSVLRNTWIGRKLKDHGNKIITREILQEDIDKLGKPMVDKVFQIIEYFNPKYWIIENPQSGRMKEYIAEKYPQYNNYNDFSYCKYSDWGYEKKTRFWNNIPNLVSNTCKKDCDNIITFDKQKLHNNRMGTSKTVEDNGKIIRCNTKALREKYKDYQNLQVGNNSIISEYGKIPKKLERYRIPEKLIYVLISNL